MRWNRQAGLQIRREGRQIAQASRSSPQQLLSGRRLCNWVGSQTTAEHSRLLELIQRLRHCRLRAYLLWRVHDNSRTLQRPRRQVTSRDYESNILVGTAICYPHCLKPRRCSSYPGLRGPRSKWRRMWFLFSNSSSLWLFSRYLWTTLLGHQSCSLRRRGYPSSWRPSQGNPFLHSLRLLQHNRYFRSQQSLVFFSVDRKVCV